MMQLAPGTKLRAKEAQWSEDLVSRLEASPLSDTQVANLIALRMTEERAGKYLGIIEANPDNPMLRFQLNFARPTTEMGIRARPGPNGLGMREINLGSYGYVPDRWPYENDTPLGSRPTPGAYTPGSYSIFEKSEVWAEDLDLLYEEAIRDRWAPASDIKWAELEPQADELERAICQVCTVFAQHGLAESKLLASWEEKIAYGFHDMKNYMATEIFDSGRKVEVLRKRALANGGGLGQQGLGTMYRAWFGALKFTELCTAINVVYKSYEVTAFEKLAEALPQAVDRDIFARLAKDSRRHLKFGVDHLRYYMQHHPNAHEYVVHFLNRAEAAFANELQYSKVEGEPLVVLFAGGLERIEQGKMQLQSLRQEQVKRYLELLRSAKIDRLATINQGLLFEAGLV
jgi:hypothetical protein